MAELIWDGKYDKEGKKQAPVRLALPFQTIETVNESAQERQRSLEMFAEGRDSGWRNRLIWGDKKYVLSSLREELAGKVGLIYIDPPFDTGADFSYNTTIPESDETFVKEPSILEQNAYRDTWGVDLEDRRRGVSELDRYAGWLYQAAILLFELLANDGSIYVHIGSNVSHYVKIIFDDVFGRDHFVNEVVWRRAFAHNDPARCGVIHDDIFYYSKGEKRTWNRIFQKPSAEYVDQFFDQYDPVRKERYARLPLDAPRHGDGGNLIYEWKGAWPAKNRLGRARLKECVSTRRLGEFTTRVRASHVSKDTRANTREPFCRIYGSTLIKFTINHRNCFTTLLRNRKHSLNESLRPPPMKVI